MRSLIQIQSFLLYLNLPRRVNSTLFFTFPLVGTTLSGGQSSTITWQDDGQNPLLVDYGLTAFGIYVGNANDQIQVQQLSTNSLVNVSATGSLAFTVNPSAGPNSDQYFIKASSNNGQVAFSTRFSLTNMTGSFTPAESSLVFTSTTPPSSTSTTTSLSPSSSPTPTTNGATTTASSKSSSGSSSHTSTPAPSGTPTNGPSGTNSGPHESSTPLDGAPAEKTQSDGRRLSAGAIYGIVASLCVLIMVTTVTLWCGYRRRRRQKLALNSPGLLEEENDAAAANASSPSPSNAPNTPIAGPSRQPTEMTQTTNRRISPAPELVTMPSDLSLMDPPLQHAPESVDMMYDVIPPGSEKPIRVLSYRRPPSAAARNSEDPPPLVEITSPVSPISPTENSESSHRQLQRQQSLRDGFYRPPPSNIPEDVSESAPSPRLFDPPGSPFRFAQVQAQQELSPFRTPPSEERPPSPLGSKEPEGNPTAESLSEDLSSTTHGSKVHESIRIVREVDQLPEEDEEEGEGGGEDQAEETQDANNVRDSRTPSEIRAREAYLERQIENLRHLFLRTAQGEAVSNVSVEQDLDEPPPTYHPRSP